MSRKIDSRFDPGKLRIDTGEVWAAVPKKIKKRRTQFAMLPMTWYERMAGASGQTCRVAWFLLYLHWKNNGDPIKLANGMLEMDGVSRHSKLRALRVLERRGLIAVDWQRKKSPIVRKLYLVT
jgi:hypothetical protein